MEQSIHIILFCFISTVHEKWQEPFSMKKTVKFYQSEATLLCMYLKAKE